MSDDHLPPNHLPADHLPMDFEALARLPNVFPRIRCRDASWMIDWLGRAFGFEAHAVYPDGRGGITHAELRFGAGLVWLASGDPAGAGSTYIVTHPDELDACHDRALAEGAEPLSHISETDFGTREFRVADPEGNEWIFGTYHPLAGDLVDVD